MSTDGPSRVIPHGVPGLAGWETTVVWAHAPDVTTWRLRAPDGEVRYLKVAHLGREASLTEERDRLQWAAAWLPVPRVLDYGADDAHEWLITVGLPGVDATDDHLRADPPRLVPLLAAGLRQFHAVPVDSCPFDFRVDVALSIAEQRVACGLVDSERDFHRVHAHLAPAEALDQLRQRRPQHEDLVVCHGDYCLPNALIHDDRVVGYVDLGRLGVADRWWDLAIATWSVTWNLGPGWEDLFLEAYGIAPDPEKIAFYRLLYDLLP